MSPGAQSRNEREKRFQSLPMPLPHGLIPGPQGWSVSHHIQDLGPNRIPVVACEGRTERTLPSGECQERCSGPRVRTWGSEALGSHLARLPARTAPKLGTSPSLPQRPGKMQICCTRDPTLSPTPGKPHGAQGAGSDLGKEEGQAMRREGWRLECTPRRAQDEKTPAGWVS